MAPRIRNPRADRASTSEIYCVKGYYKRAKAHAAVWNEKEARRDFNMVANLDITLASLVNRELKVLSERMKEKYWEEKETYWNMLEKTKNGEGEKEDGHDDTERLKQVEDISKENGNGDDVQRVTADEKGEESPSNSAGVTRD
ncbi:peptidyl-prolyl cis-trans isomerase PASTICCINO1-like, partial [Thalassophryne amazonica]|uniref:peptidyl-prolyl cis-trans isomerase PASTICCINO1-like n=1 Tax=Thalassophryne amazonica TaxID=390379 RepID=UPI0014709189